MASVNKIALYNLANTEWTFVDNSTLQVPARATRLLQTCSTRRVSAPQAGLAYE